MLSTERDARHLQELQKLEVILKEMGFPTQLLRRSEPLPQHALVTRLLAPQGQTSVEMALTFYPVEPDTVHHTLLLQYYVQLRFDLQGSALDRYRQLLPDLNGKAVLGHFGIDIGSGKPHYRYVQALPIDRPITKEAIIDVLILVGYTPVLFDELLDAIANNRIDVESARRQLQSAYSL